MYQKENVYNSFKVVYEKTTHKKRESCKVKMYSLNTHNATPGVQKSLAENHCLMR